MEKETRTAPLYPDIAACGMRDMQLHLHTTGGLEQIEDFWQRHDLEPSTARLVFSGYKTTGGQQTVAIRWARSHAACCDIHITFDARPPKVVMRLPDELSEREEVEHRHRLSEDVFQEFVNLLSTMKLPGKITAQYTILWKESLDSLVRATERIRPTSLSFNVVDNKGKTVFRMTHRAEGQSWLLVIEPAWGFKLPKNDPAPFAKIYETGCSLVEELRGKSK